MKAFCLVIAIFKYLFLGTGTLLLPLDLALANYLRTTTFDGGLIGGYRFDSYGAVSGINFALQIIRAGKVKKLSE